MFSSSSSSSSNVTHDESASFHRINAEVYKMLRKGDIFEIIRSGVSQWGVFLGDSDLVIRLKEEFLENEMFCQCKQQGQGENNGLATCQQCGFPFKYAVIYDSYLAFIERGTVKKHVSDTRAFPANTIVERAKSMLGPLPRGSDIRNSEDFAKWCRYDNF